MKKTHRTLACSLALLLAVCLWPLTGSALAAAAAAEPRYIISQGGLQGFMDQRGTVVIEPRFSKVRQFREGLAAAKPSGSELYGYIDPTGRLAIAPQFRVAGDFSEGLATVDGGYVDREGTLVIARQGSPFRHGRARLYGQPAVLVDRTGGVVLETPYEEVWETGGELLAFVERGKMGFMTWQKEVVIPPRFHPPRYRREDLFNEAVAPVCLGTGSKGKWGFINKKGETVVDFRYDWADQFREGLALVGRDGLYGYVDAAGRLAIPLQFEEAENFSEGLAAVKVGGVWGFIDKQGRMVITPQFLGLLWGSPMAFQEGLCVVRTPNGTGAIDQTGEIVVAPVYRTVGDFSGGLAEVVLPNGLRGYVDIKGEYVWRPSR